MARHVRPYPQELRERRCGWSLRCARRIGRSGLQLSRSCRGWGSGPPETLRGWLAQAEIDAGHGRVSSDQAFFNTERHHECLDDLTPATV